MNDDSMEFAPCPSSDFWFAMVDIAVIRDAELSPRDIQLFCILRSFANIKTESWILKIETIAQAANCDKRTAQRSIARLIERGVIARTPRFKDGKELAPLWTIIGHKAPCYQNTDDKIVTHDKIVAPRDDKIVTPYLPEPKTNDTKDTLTGSEAAAPTATRNETTARDETTAPQRTERYPVSEAPQVFRQTAEYLLLKTGRTALKETEISALRTLNAHHSPARVQLEIDKAVERYGRLKRPLASLDFVYIAESLKHQTSRPKGGGQGAAPRKGQPKFSEPEAREFTQEQEDYLEAAHAGKKLDPEYWAYLNSKYGGGKLWQ